MHAFLIPKLVCSHIFFIFFTLSPIVIWICVFLCSCMKFNCNLQLDSFIKAAVDVQLISKQKYALGNYKHKTPHKNIMIWSWRCLGDPKMLEIPELWCISQEKLGENHPKRKNCVAVNKAERNWKSDIKMQKLEFDQLVFSLSFIQYIPCMMG